MNLLRVLALSLFCVTLSSQAVTRDVYEFDSAETEQRFQQLIAELRCPKCQNQNIADSNAPISKDMRDEVYRMIQEGASNEEVTNALVSRFGEFVRYKPEVNRQTLLLWATPAIVVITGLLIVSILIFRGRKTAQADASLSDEERERAEALLAEASGRQTDSSTSR